MRIHYRIPNRDRQIRAVVLLSLVAAGAVRLLYAFWSMPDFWGDAYHHWLISRLTLANDWVYTDFKGLETIWLPGYHYLVAAVMAVWGRLDLAPAHLTNLVLGTMICGLVTRLVANIAKDRRAGLGAGLSLAFAPWHIVYSHINMPEVLAGLLLMLTLLAARRGHAGWLAGLALVSALTRHEPTLLLAIVAVWLGWRRRWGAVLSLMLGSAFGLGLWSLWSQHITGDAFAWLSRYRVATAWDARYWANVSLRLTDLRTLVETTFQVYPPLTLVVAVVFVCILHGPWRRRVPSEGWLLMALVGLHWLFLGLVFEAGNLPVADPRYLLITIPALVAVGIITIAAIPHRRTRWLLAGSYGALVLLALPIQYSAIGGRDYVLAPERAAGEYLGRAAPVEGNFWVDAPVAIFYSRLEPERFFSSEQLLPDEMRWREDTPDIALAAIHAHDIRFVLWDDVPYTFVQYLWPQMAEGQAFFQGAVRFQPVFRFSGWEVDYGARPTILWQITLEGE